MACRRLSTRQSPSLASGFRTGTVSGGFETVRDLSRVLAVAQPLREPGGRRSGDFRQGGRLGVPQFVESIGELGVLRCAVRIDYVPERCRFRRWRLWVKLREVKLGEIGGDVLGPSVSYQPGPTQYAAGELLLACGPTTRRSGAGRRPGDKGRPSCGSW